MDPLTIIGGLASTAQIAGGILQITKNLNDARKRYKAADTTIKLLVTELLSIKAAVGQIEDWARYNSAESAMTPELVEGFKHSFEGCHLAMDTLASEVVSLTSRNPFLVKAGVAWNEATMKEHSERLKSQVSVLQLLIRAVHCQSPHQQKDLLDNPTNHSIIQKVVDDTSTLRASRRYSEFGSGPPTIVSNTNSTVGSIVFDMDQALVNTPPYQRARKHHHSKSFDYQPHNPFLRERKPESPHPVIPSGPPPTSPTIITTSSDESKIDSGFYDQDADIVNPERYRETISKIKAPNPITRSISDPLSRPPNEPAQARIN
jgi:hypothetical protein